MSDILKNRLTAATIFLVGVVLALCAPINMVVFGPFIWAVEQPGAWQGAIEIAVLASLIGAATYWLQGWQRGLLLAFLCFAYARRHGVDLAVFGSLLYFEGIVDLGYFISRRMMLEVGSKAQTNLIAIVIGTLTWCCLEWGMSFVGFGSFGELQVAGVFVLGGALVAEKRLPIVSWTYSYLGRRNIPASLACGLACAVVLMLFAKSAISIDFDSLWYGMRGDRVLVASGSVFKSLGLVASVHYAPQAYELLIVPLCGLHSIPAIFGLSIWSLVAMAICLYAIGERLGWKPILNLTMISLAITTPAVLNIAITAKGDVLGAFWILFGLYAYLRYRQSRDWHWLLVLLASAAVATCFRMSVFVYSGLLMLVALIHIVSDAVRRPKTVFVDRLPSYFWIWLVGSSFLLFFLVTLRTFLLAGIPFIEPRMLVHLSEWFGFIRRFPVSNAPPQEIRFNEGILPLLADFALMPAKLPHVVIGWTGGAYIFLMAVGLAFNRSKIILFKELAMFFLMACMFIIILLFVYFPDPGGDGNYYIVPVVCFIIVGLGLIGTRIQQKNAVGKSLRSTIYIFVISSILISLVTGSWGPGTRGFDFDFGKPAKDFKPRAMAQVSYYGMAPVYEFLRKLPINTRVISVLPDSMNANLPDSWLPVREESLNAINSYMPTYTESSQAIEQFIKRDDIDYLMIPPKNSPDTSSAMIERTRQAVDHLEVEHRAREVVKGDRFSLWKILPAANATLSVERVENSK